MDINLYCLVESIVRDFIAKGQLFTSVNISNHIKKEKKTWIKNSEIASWLRQNIGSLSSYYCTTSIDVANGQGTTKANLYHPANVDPSCYTDVNLHAMTPDEFKQLHNIDPFTGQTIAQASQTVQTALHQSATIVTQSKVIQQKPVIIRDVYRIRVPAKMISAIGLKRGDFVKADKFVTTITIPAKLRVHKDGRLSIPRTCIKFNGKSIGTRPVKVFIRDNKIGFESISGKS